MQLRQRRSSLQLHFGQRKDPDVHAKILSIIVDYLVGGYARKAVSLEHLALDRSKVWHVSLNIVSKPRKDKLSTGSKGSWKW